MKKVKQFIKLAQLGIKDGLFSCFSNLYET
jgi:hypothetical protein